MPLVEFIETPQRGFDRLNPGLTTGYPSLRTKRAYARPLRIRFQYTCGKMSRSTTQDSLLSFQVGTRGTVGMGR
jgi:hypothetical protein